MGRRGLLWYQNKLMANKHSNSISINLEHLSSFNGRHKLFKYKFLIISNPNVLMFKCLILSNPLVLQFKCIICLPSISSSNVLHHNSFNALQGLFKYEFLGKFLIISKPHVPKFKYLIHSFKFFISSLQVCSIKIFDSSPKILNLTIYTNLNNIEGK